MSKQFIFKQFNCAWVHVLNIKTNIFQSVQFSISTQFSSFLPIDRPYRMLSFRTTVDLWAIAIKGYTAFPKAPTSHCLVSYNRTLAGGVLPLSINSVGIFYTSKRLGQVIFQVVQFTISTQVKYHTDLFNPLIGPYQVLQLLVRVGLRSMSYPCVKMQLVYSAAQADWTKYEEESWGLEECCCISVQCKNII